MIKLSWNNGEVPEGMKVKQVYGLVFTKDGRLILMAKERENGIIYSLAGGTPEKFDADREVTLRRELMEEINITIGKPIMVGYQEVDEEDGKPAYAQVRMVAMLDEIKESQPDPDTGETYKRILTHPKKAIEKLNWGEIGKLLVEEGVRIAIKNFGLKEFKDKDEWV
ncbi:MAG: NUDIX hydrolase [Spirochaetales bacterium]